MSLAAAIFASAALAGCGSRKAPEPAPTASVSAAPAMAPSAAPGMVPATTMAPARHVDEKSDLYEFSYAYPAAAAALPALKAKLDAEIASERASLAKDAREAKADAATNDFPYNAYSRDYDWKVVTDLPGWLSLSTIAGEYTGGAHPNYAFRTLLWDKGANAERQVMDLFTGKAALSAAIRAPFCATLDKERAKRRGAPVNAASGDEFDKCIDPVEETVILGSSDRQHFDRIGVLVAPYDAGPYAEGSYEITVPVTPAVLAAVRPNYRAAFALSR